MIYFDNASTTFPKPKPVIDAVSKSIEFAAVNPGRGIYPLAQEADRIIYQTRTKVLKLLGYTSGTVIFSPSATLALNQILFGLNWQRGDIVYTTPLEHNAVYRTLYNVQKKYEIQLKNIFLDSKTYTYDLDIIKEDFFKNPPKVVVMTHISNVMGLITPIIEIAKLAKEYNAVVVIDGAQGGPLAALNKEDSNIIDFYVFSGHKTFYGPFGIAGFVTNNKVNLNPIFYGGTGSHSELLEMPDDLPFKHEVGSHNIIAISGLNAACDWLLEISPYKIVEKEKELMISIIEKLKELTNIKLYIHNDIEKHQGLFSFNILGIDSQEAGTILGQSFDIAVRAGLHCAPMAHKFLNTSPKGTIRVSFGFFNENEEIDKFINAITEIVSS